MRYSLSSKVIAWTVFGAAYIGAFLIVLAS